MTTCRAASFLLLALAAILAPASDAPAQAPPARLVVFEGFYNPG